MLFLIPKKFAEKQLDQLVNDIFHYYRSSPRGKFIFDFTQVEYIDNQELLVLSGIFKIFVKGDLDLEIILLPKGVAIPEMNERVKKQLVQIWEVWKIYKVVDETAYKKFFGIDGNAILAVQRDIDYYPETAEIYTRHGVTPLVILDYINNYDAPQIEGAIEAIYRLNSATSELLNRYHCSHPFTSQALSTIITEELYLNFLDHSEKSSFEGLPNYAFMSISLQEPFSTEYFTNDEIQEWSKLNYSTERITESKSFYFDEKASKYRNSPYLQFSFLDFGQGIAESLRAQYVSKHPHANGPNLDNQILKYAFKHDSSRHPLGNDNQTAAMFSRGLFDVFTMAKRYNGMMTVRSNFGKIIYNFVNAQLSVFEASYIKNKANTYFPGTLITLSLPAIRDAKKLNTSTIKPDVSFTKVKPKDKTFVSINLIANRIDKQKKNLYKDLIADLRSAIISNNPNPSLTIVSFKSCEWVDRRVLVKALEFLVGDYHINLHNNVVVINPPDAALIEEVDGKINALSLAVKNYKIHPLPIVRFNETSQMIDVQWLGIFQETDRKQLNNLLYDDYIVARSDLRDPSNATGNLNAFDHQGNLLSNFPTQAELLTYLRANESGAAAARIRALIEYHDCIKGEPDKNLFLCHGNYYQHQYVELNNLTNDKLSCNVVTGDLLDRVLMKITNLEDYQFIGITATSHKMLKSLENQRLIDHNDYILLDSYYSFEDDLVQENIKEGRKIILFCDVISTGFLTQKLAAKLIDLGTELALIAVIVSTIDPSFDQTKLFMTKFGDKIISLLELPILKYSADQIREEILKKRITRINPYTNIPITLSIGDTGYHDAVIFPTMIYAGVKKNEIVFTNRFLDNVPDDAIKLGYLRYNNLVHPYFFDTEIILQHIEQQALEEIFKKIDKPGLSKDRVKIFYPRQSSIDSFDFTMLMSVLKNQAIDNIEIERFPTKEGWRFPSNTEYLNSQIDNNICLILDDGSCSGDSLIQMIDEIAFYPAKEIILLCVVGRVNDHKREFFTRLDRIRVKNKRSIPVAIYFAAHWHIPTYYIDENPLSQETTWLNDINKIQNTPPAIKNIAETILRNLRVQPPARFIDYKFLPKDKVTKQIPKREILLVREEVGKVIGYRLYKESFRFFNLFIKKYSVQKQTENRYKELELLCATFAYEPYIFDKVRYIMPDVVDVVKGFLRVLIFNYNKIEKSLTYSWNKIDILHLFFTVFKGQDLLNELTPTNFRTILTFSDTDSKFMSVNYVLYKLLYYFTGPDKELHRFSSAIKRVLLQADENELLAIELRSRIKIYRWFISTLPSKNSFDDMLVRLKSNYERILDEQFHDDNIYNDKQIISSLLLEIGNKVRKSAPYAQDLITVRTHWEKIARFIKDLLSFSIKFPEFFIDPKIFYELEEQEGSLRTLFGELTTAFYADDININEVSKKLDELFVKYIFEESNALKIFSAPVTPRVIEYVDAFTKKLTNKYPNAKIKVNNINSVALDFPQYFLELVFNELFNNLRYSDSSRDLVLKIKVTHKGYLKVSLWNFNNQDKLRKGGNTGEKILNNLKSSLLDSFYKRYATDLTYLQILKFKMI